MSSQLNSVKKYTKVVADTGDFNLIAKYKPTDSTTNPSLIKQACSLPQYKHLIDAAVEQEKKLNRKPEELVNKIIERLIVLFGCEILKIIPGMVSSEIDASYSFDIDGMVQKGLDILNLYKEYGINSDRVYLKIPATWEGIQAAKILKTKHSGVHLNMTLVFSLVQAVACADVGADLISPFVGRITDWYKNNKGLNISTIEEDPGVINVRKIYNYYKQHGIGTIVMGASFRTVDQVKALCGLDALTISPKLLDELDKAEGDVSPCVSIDVAKKGNIESMVVDEKKFRWLMNCDEMASFKLDEGIRLFHKDTELLREEVRKMIQAN